MIFIDTDVYEISLQLNDKDAGMLLKYAIDLMEQRNMEDSSVDGAMRATEIPPEPFPDFDEPISYSQKVEADLYFTGFEFLFISRFAYLMRHFVDGLHDFAVKAYVQEHERGLIIGAGDFERKVKLPEDCGNQYILRQMMSAIYELVCQREFRYVDDEA